MSSANFLILFLPVIAHRTPLSPSIRAKSRLQAYVSCLPIAMIGCSDTRLPKPRASRFSHRLTRCRFFPRGRKSFSPSGKFSALVKCRRRLPTLSMRQGRERGTHKVIDGLYSFRPIDAACVLEYFGSRAQLFFRKVYQLLLRHRFHRAG